MVTTAPLEKRNLIYLYDLPKDHFTSARLAKILKTSGIELELKPQVRRDPTKPFYSCILCIKDESQFKKASEVLRYFDIEGKQCRGLPFDNTLLGTNLTKTNEQCSIFVRKIPKDMNASDLDEKFSCFDPSGKKRQVKSLKISIDEDHSSRGYGFITYDNPEDAQMAIQMLQESESYVDCVAVPYKPKDRQDVRRIANNLYVKNYPENFTDEQVRGLFEPFGRIESISQKENSKIGCNFAFVCFMAEDKNDHEYGPECAQKAINNLNGQDMGDGRKLYVQPALNLCKRQEQKLRETIKYKNSKKRCNLYVKNFDPKSTEDNLRDIFKEFGEIESVKMFPDGPGDKAYAFVCFKTPDQAQTALSTLPNRLVNNRQLSICHYELKEYRTILDEETKDKLGFQQFKQANYSQMNMWNDINSRDEFYYRMMQIISTLPIQNKMGGQGQNPAFRQGGFRQQRDQNQGGQGQRPDMGQRRPQNQNRGPHMGGPNMGGQMGGQNGYQGRQPQPHMGGGYNQPPMMGGHPGHQQVQSMPPPSQGQMMQQNPMMQTENPEQQRFLNATSRLVPSVKADNPMLKSQVGNAIFDFVQTIKGREMAPKITGMLIDLNLDEIQAYLQNYQEFKKKVSEAAILLEPKGPMPMPTQGGHQMPPMPQPGMPMPMGGMPGPGFPGQ